MPWVSRLFRSALVDKVPRDHSQPDSEFRRRRLVVLVTLVVGTVLLGISLSVRPGDVAFYPLTSMVALTWIVGGLWSGPLHLGYVAVGGTRRRPLLTGLALGVLAGCVFIAGGLVVRQVPTLRDYVDAVLAHARYGSIGPIALITLANGIAEEVFFRGALFAAIGRLHPVLVSTAMYTVVTMVTGNPMLVFAGCALGLLLGLQRRASGGLLGPIVTHTTWSIMMLFLLPPLFA